MTQLSFSDGDRFGGEAETDDDGGQAVPSLLNLQQKVVSGYADGLALEPAYGPFDDPTDTAQATAVFFAPARDPRTNTEPTQDASRRLTVVPPISIQVTVHAYLAWRAH